MKSSIKKSSLSLKKKLIIRVGIVSILIGAIVLLIILPEVKKIVEIREVINEQQQSIEKEHEQSKRLKETLAELDHGLQVAEQISEATVKSGEELRVITQFEQLSESLNLTQQLSLNQKDVEPASPLRPQGIGQYYLLSVSVSGNFENVVEFVQKLEQLPFYVAIDSMTWQSGAQRDGQQTVSLRFEAKVYIYQPPANN